MAYYDRTYRLGFGGGITPAIKYLLISNIALFLIFFISGVQPFVEKWLALSFTGISELKVWQLCTYLFLHSGPWHLLWNMLFLWIFGCEVERTLGTKEFVKFYMICGVGAGICHMIVSPAAPVIGASGAIYGVMAAFGVLFPERVITLLLFFVLPIQVKVKYLVMFFAGLALFLGIVSTSDGVAHFAHLGGMLVGFLYLKMDWQIDYIGNWLRQKQESKKAVQSLKKHQAMQEIRERVDEILDKINEVGYDSLDDEEKRILREASQKFSQEPEPDN